MPLYHNKTIISINKHQLIKYDIIKRKNYILTFDGILEEPTIYDNKIFLLIHEANTTTSLIIIDFNSFIIIHTYNFLQEISYGFHGTFIPINKNNSILTDY